MAQQETQAIGKQSEQAQTKAARSPRNEVATRGTFDPARLWLGPAELFRMGPFSLMTRLMEELDRASEEAGGPAWTPAIEVSADNGKLAIRAELSGMKPEDVKVEVSNGELILQGERKFEREENKQGLYRTERRYGRFYRAIPLPKEADMEHARAKFENGVLEITMPVANEEKNRRQIPVEAASVGSTSAQSA
jgi:HSP20 family protein